MVVELRTSLDLPLADIVEAMRRCLECPGYRAPAELISNPPGLQRVLF